MHSLFFSSFGGLESRRFKYHLYFQEQGNEKTNNGTHYKLQLLYSNGEHPRPLCPSTHTCPFQGKQLTLSRSLADSIRPGESRALGGLVKKGAWEGGLCPRDNLAAGLSSAAPSSCLGLTPCAIGWGCLGGLLSPDPMPTTSPHPRRCPHRAGLVRQAHRLSHQAGEPCGPLLSSSGGEGLPHLSLTFPHPP